MKNLHRCTVPLLTEITIKRILTDTDFVLVLCLLELKNKVLVVLQKGELSLQGSPLQRLLQSETLAPLFGQPRFNLNKEFLQLRKHTSVIIFDALGESEGWSDPGGVLSSARVFNVVSILFFML